ncbi:MAG: ATP-binding protein, partial [Dehalococcoidia bacterium]
MTSSPKLDSMLEIVSLTHSGGEEEKVVEGILHWIFNQSWQRGPGRTFILLYHEETGTMRLTVAEPEQLPQQTRLAGNQAEAFKHWLQDWTDPEPRVLGVADPSSQLFRLAVGATGDSQVIGFPLRVSRKTYGMLGIQLYEAQEPASEDLEVICQYAQVAGICLRNAQLYEAQARECRELKHEDELRRSYISFMTHEFRTPLASLKTCFELIQESEEMQSLADPYQRLIVNVNRSVASLDQLINDMAEAANLASGGVLLNKAPTSPRDVVYPVIEITTPLSQVKNQRLEVNVPPDLPDFMADSHRLEQVLTNMVSNAIKYTPAGGLIQAQVAREEFCIRFTVSDSGEGIPSEHLEHIFEPFYRVPQANGKRPPGTG